jgi:phospholipid transport system substrate-binding protein
MAVPLLAVVVAFLLAASAASADPPHVTTATDELRRHLDDVIALAQTPSFRALEAAERRTAMRRITDRLFNWSEIAKRALGPHWKERTVAERRRFAGWFASLAERGYTGSIDQLGARRVPANAVRYLGETTSGGDTIVRTTFPYGRDLPVDFVMSKRARQWEVCDVHVDGVSMAENYRAQLQRVIASDSFPGVVERMSATTRANAR